MRNDVVKIWENGKKDEIIDLMWFLQQQEDHPYRIIKRSPGAVERYLRNHTREDGFIVHPIRYEWDGYVWLLEKLQY